MKTPHHCLLLDASNNYRSCLTKPQGNCLQRCGQEPGACRGPEPIPVATDGQQALTTTRRCRTLGSMS
eukprot:2415926-Amphidinium_carterae.1